MSLKIGKYLMKLKRTKCGYFGGHPVDALTERSWAISVMDRQPTQHHPSL